MPTSMHSRFWTFCAVSNMLLFLVSVIVIYLKKDISTNVHMSLTHRSVTQYSSAIRVWRDYYSAMSAVSDTPDYQSFLQVGLDAVGCTANTTLSVCSCLAEAHAVGISQCKAAAEEKMSHCFMTLRPVMQIDELDRSLNPFALLDTMNLWGMMGSVLIYMRMSVSRDDESMPNTVQMFFGILASVIHCSVMEPQWESYLTFLILVLAMSFISYLHRLDKEWWVSAFHVQYMFIVPNLIVLERVLTQRRDFSYIVFGFTIGVAFAFVSFAKTFLEQIKQDSKELASVHNCLRMVLLSIIVVLCLTTYPASGTYYFESVNVTSALVLFYLMLGLFGTSNIKRVYFMELLLRAVISINMLVELGLAHN